MLQAAGMTCTQEYDHGDSCHTARCSIALRSCFLRYNLHVMGCCRLEMARHCAGRVGRWRSCCARVWCLIWSARL